MDTAFELSTTDRYGGLLMKKQQLYRSNEYYNEIHPTEAHAVDAAFAEARAAAELKTKQAAEARAAKPIAEVQRTTEN